MGPRPNVKSGKLIQMFPDFSAGLNTNSAIHQVDDNEFVYGQNADLDERGSISKRRGYTRLPSQPAGDIQGIYSFRLRAARHLLAVAGGSLFRYATTDPSPVSLLVSGTWTRVPIRLVAPANTQATLNDIDSQHTPDTTYEYRVVAVDASGKTTAADATIKNNLNVTRVTQSTPAKQVLVTWTKSLGALKYEVYRAVVTSGTPEDFQRIAVVGDVAEWLDTGNNQPDLSETLPTANTTNFQFINQDASFVAWNDQLYVTCGNGLVTWNGTGDAQIVAPYFPSNTEISVVGANSYIDVTSSIHTCRFIKVHADRMFLCGDTVYPQNVYFTDLGMSPGGGTYSYVPGHYAFDVTTDNNEPVTGVYNFRDALVFFTRTSIHTLFGRQPDSDKSDAFILRVTNYAVGCESMRSIAAVNNSLVFVNQNGVYALVSVTASDTNMNVTYLSQKIEPTFRKLRGQSKCTAVFHDQQYKVSFPEEGVVLRWYINRQAWTLDYSIDRFTHYLLWGVDLYQTSQSTIYKAGYKVGTSGQEVPTYSDDGLPIDFRFHSKSFDLKAMVNLKKVRTLYVMAKQQEVESTAHIDVYVDYEKQGFDFSSNESTALGALELGISTLGWVDVVFQEKPCKAKGHQISFEVSNSKLDEPVTIYGLGLEYKIKHA